MKLSIDAIMGLAHIAALPSSRPLLGEGGQAAAGPFSSADGRRARLSFRAKREALWGDGILVGEGMRLGLPTTRPAGGARVPEALGILEGEAAAAPSEPSTIAITSS